jgi:hypothetical protein
MLSKFSKIVAFSAKIGRRNTYYAVASFSNYQDPKQKFQQQPPQKQGQSLSEKLEERAKNPDYMELLGFDRPAEIDPEAPGLFVQEMQAKLPQEFRVILQKYPNEIQNFIASEGKDKIPPQLITDVMDALGKMAEQNPEKLFPKLFAQLRNQNLEGEPLIKEIKAFMGKNWWYHGGINHILQGMGFTPSAWEQNLSEIHSADKSFANLYGNFQRKILDQLFQLNRLSEQQKGELQNFFDKEFKDLSKATLQYDGITAKVDHLLKDKIGLDLGAAAEKVADVARKAMGRK